MPNSVRSVNKSAAEVSLPGSPESPAAETLKAIELLCYMELSGKDHGGASLSNEVLRASAAAGSCGVVILFQTK